MCVSRWVGMCGRSVPLTTRAKLINCKICLYYICKLIAGKKNVSWCFPSDVMEIDYYNLQEDATRLLSEYYI